MLATILLVAGAHADCTDCCRAGGSCARAYKQSPGVCCGGGYPQCCPAGHRCGTCNYATYRCFAPHERAPTCYDGRDAAWLSGVVCTLGLVACVVLCLRRRDPPVATPYAGDATMGFVTGMLVAEALDAECPPSYAEATVGTEADA